MVEGDLAAMSLAIAQESQELAEFLKKREAAFNRRKLLLAEKREISAEVKQNWSTMLELEVILVKPHHSRVCHDQLLYCY